MQGLRVDGDAALPLAVLVLSEPRDGADQRLDGRDLSALGRGARRVHRCPVHWYQAPASLKLMIDRLVCADGGNPDSDHDDGKDPVRPRRSS